MKRTGKPLSSELNFSSAYYFKNLKELKQYHSNKFINTRYSRDLNITTLELENFFSSLYKGSKALCFSSGMSAIGASMGGMVTNKNTIITFGNFYRKSRSLIKQLEKVSNLVSINFIDYKKFINWSKNYRQKGKKIIFFLEMPSNPFLKIIDIKDIRKRFPEATIITDLSFAGAKNDKNLLKFCDIIVLSLTKYISGHNDVLGGALIIKNKKDYSQIWSYRSTFGGVLDVFSAYLTLRSLKTYDLRILRMLENTKIILKFLGSQTGVKKIWYPGEFENLNQKKRFSEYFNHGGSVITFETKKINSINLFKKMKTIKMAPSFGSTDSLIEWPYYMSYFSQNKKNLKKIKINKNLVRLAVGCENIKLLIKDLEIFKK